MSQAVFTYKEVVLDCVASVTRGLDFQREVARALGGMCAVFLIYV